MKRKNGRGRRDNMGDTYSDIIGRGEIKSTEFKIKSTEFRLVVEKSESKTQKDGFPCLRGRT